MLPTSESDSMDVERTILDAAEDNPTTRQNEEEGNGYLRPTLHHACELSQP